MRKPEEKQFGAMTNVIETKYYTLEIIVSWYIHSIYADMKHSNMEVF